MITQYTPQVKDKAWKEYSKKSTAKNELKNIFLGNKPTETYSRIKDKIKKELTKVDKKKTLKPTLIKSPKRKVKSPKRKVKSPKRTISPKRKVKSPKRKVKSPKRKVKSPKKIKSPKKKVKSPKRSKRISVVKVD